MYEPASSIYNETISWIAIQTLSKILESWISRYGLFVPFPRQMLRRLFGRLAPYRTSSPHPQTVTIILRNLLSGHQASQFLSLEYNLIPAGFRLSQRTFHSPDTRRTQSIDFTPALSHPSDRSQSQAQLRGILRQPQNHKPPPISRSPEWEPGYFQRPPALQQLNADSHPSRSDRFGPRLSLPTTRIFEIDTENDSVARACGQTPSPALRYQPKSYPTHTPSTDPNRSRACAAWTSGSPAA